MSESSELARGRSRKKSKINADQTAMVRMPDGTIEQLDAGTLLSDLIRSFGPHAHLIEVEDTIALTSSFQVSSPLSHPSSSSSSPPPPPVALVSGLVHRAASYELKVGSMYRLVIDEPSSSSSSTASGEEVRLLSKQVATLLETLNQTLGNTNRLLLQDRSSLMGTPPSDLEENEREIGETEAEKIAKFQAFELASSRSLSSIQRGPHAATPSMVASSATSSMLSAFTMTRSNCSGCHGPISMMSMRKKCAVCQLGYCRRCCRLKISLPIYYGYDRTKYVCKNCLPRAFLSRHGISLDGGDIELQKNHGSEVNLKLKLASLSNSSPDIKNLIGRLVKGTFYTLSSGTISFSMKIFDPIVRFSFWWSGMKEGDKFDRTALEAAMGAKVSPYQNHMEAVVRVPQDWKVLGKRTPVEEPEILHKISGRRQWDASIKTYDVQMLLYFPKKSQVSAPDQPLPAVVYYHGGGFCIGHASDSSYHTLCYKMAKKSGSVVISVEYRLAPESKYPTQLEDGYAAFHWVHSNSAQFNIDKNRIAVSGDSAGGTIAAVVSLLSRDRGAPTPCHQLLYYPCLTDPITDEIPSQAKYSAGPVLTRDVLKWFMSSLFDNYEHEMKTSCYANPLMWIDSFEGIPPATIINAMHDPLADHGKMYAWRLRRAGIPVHHSVYTNCVHGFICSVGLLPEANEALAEGVVFLRRAFDTLSPAPTPLVSPRTTASLSSSLRCTS